MADISQIKLPSGVTYDLRDANIPNTIKFEEVGYEPQSFADAKAMLKDLAENVIQSDSCMHLVRVTYGAYWSVIIQSYKNTDYRGVFAISYDNRASKPIFMRKYNGTWYE